MIVFHAAKIRGPT